jgi:hypothetical protein
MLDMGHPVFSGSFADGELMKASYERLPGRRRGFIRGASLWLGDDHLLLVRSMRFREEYKRFHLRDIQAIVVARTPRIHVSTRAFGLVILYAIAYGIVRGFYARELPYLWAAAAIAVAVWLYISLWDSCRCRIYTAVSSDDLPSIYRTWTARRFLSRVEPRIAEVQGAVQENWAEAVEERNVGAPPSVFPPEQPGAAPAHAPRAYSAAAVVLAAGLLAGGAMGLLGLRYKPPWLHWFDMGALAVQLTATTVVLIQRYRRTLKSAMHRLAIANLILTGLGYYASQFVVAVSNSMNRKGAQQVIAPLFPAGGWLRGILSGATLGLGIVGMFLILWRGEARE